MKTKLNIYIKIIIALVLFIGITIACEKEVEVKDNFNFELITNFNENGFIYETQDLALSIIQDRVIKTNQYFFKFELEQGEGYFQKEDGTTIHSLQVEKVKIKRNDVIKYISSEVGLHKLKITIYDLYENQKTVEYEYNVEHSPFTFLYTAATNNYAINQKSPTSLTYIQDGEDHFIFEYYVEGGTGTLFLDDTELSLNTGIEIPIGSHILKYLPTTLEEHIIHVKATSQDGGERELELALFVNHVDFSIEATPQGNSVNLDIELPITFSLTTEDQSNNVTYQVKYEYENDSNTGIIKNQDGDEKAPGELWDIITGSYEFFYKSIQEGTAEIKFTVVDSNTQEKEDIITFDVENVPFSFTGSTVTNDIYINNQTGLNFTLTPDGNSENIDYTLSYSQSAGNGILTNQNDEIIEPNTDLDIIPGAFSFNFVPQSLGDHTLLFIAKDSFNQEVEVEIEITAQHVPVTFVVTATNTMIVGQTTNVNFIITPNINTDTTYQMNYILIGGEGLLKDGTNSTIYPGTFQNVNTGSFTYTYSPSVQGNHVLNFQLRDSNTQMVLDDITIVVTNNDFTFSAVAEDDTILINNQTNINCNLNANVIGNTNYYLTMTKTGANANVSLNSTNLIAGQETSITPGAFSLVHMPQEIGTTSYTFIMRDELNNEIIRNIDITAGQLDFSLNVTQPATIFINQPNEFVFALVPTGTYDGITYQMSYDVLNPQLGNFENQTEAVPFDVVPVSFNMNYTPTTLGNQNIEFTITDSNLLTHTYNEIFEVVAADFTWVVNQSNETILYNTEDNVSAVLSQVITNDNITYSLSYTINGGAGQLLNDSNQPLQQGTIITGSHNYKFIASQVGTYQVNLTITDSNGVTHNQTINYNVVHTDFEMYCSSLADMYNNDNQEFQINLTQNQNDTNINYEVKFNVVNSSTGDGSIVDDNGNNMTGWQPIIVGINNYGFNSYLNGGVELLTEIREQGNNATIKDCTTSFDIINVNSNLTCIALNDNIATNGTPKGIKLLFNELPSTSFNYEIMYTQSNNIGTIDIGSGILNPNQYVAIVKGVEFMYYYIATGTGDTVINWSVRNITTNDIVATCSTSLTVVDLPVCDFSITGGAVNNSENVNNDVAVNFLFNEIDNNCLASYKFSFTTSETGTFTYNSITKSSNQEFDYDPTVAFGNYNGSNDGTHNITFTFRNIYGNVTHQFNTSIDYIATDFNWLVTQSNNNILYNTSDNITGVLNQVQSDPNVTYTLSYTINGPGVLLDNNATPLQQGAILIGNYNYTFSSNTTGNTTIVLTITDSYNTSHSQTINYTISHTGFEMYCSSLADMYINQIQNFETNVVQDINDANINYEINYVIVNGSGQILDANDNLINGWHPISSLGVQQAKFKATSQGAVSLITKVREQGNNATVKDCTTDFNVQGFTVGFTGSSQNNNIEINNNTNINFNITENPSIDNNYKLSYSYVGGASGELRAYLGGPVLSTGTNYPVTLGNFAWNFTGIQVENVEIAFILTNTDTGATYTLINNIEINVTSIPFCSPTISANALNGTAIVNEDINVNVSLGTQETTNCQGSYELYFTLPNGINGEFTINGTTLQQNEHLTITSLGFLSAIYKGLNVGTHNIVFHLLNIDNNTEATNNTSIIYDNIDFSMSCYGGNGQEIQVNNEGYFSIDFNGNTNITYEIKYIFAQGGGTILDNNDVILLNSPNNSTSWTNITTGIYLLKFKANENYIGNVDIRAEIRELNDDSTKKTCITNFDVLPIPFCNVKIGATTSNNIAYLNEQTPINFDFSKTVNSLQNCQGTYRVKFDLPNENGTLTLGTQTKGSGQWFNNITLGTMTGIYQGLSVGNHNLSFTLENIENNNIDTANLSINVQECSFTTTGSALLSTANVNTTIPITFDFNEVGSNCNTNYSFKFSSSNGNNNKFYYNGTEMSNGIYYPFNPNMTVGTYKGVNVGNHNLTFTFKNDYTNPTIVPFNVNNLDFTQTGFNLNCYGGGSSVELSIGETQNFTNVINQDYNDTSILYDIQYSFVQGTGIIKDINGNILPVNSGWSASLQSVSVNDSPFVRIFEATQFGDIQIKTEIREHNDNTTIKSCTTLFKVIEENCDYTFNYANPSNSTSMINTYTNIYFQILQSTNAVNCTTNYTMYYETIRNGQNTTDGSFRFNGNIIQDQYTEFQILPNSFVGEFITDVPGTYEITFYVTNINANTQTTLHTVTRTFTNPNINIDISGGINTVNVLDTANYPITISGGGIGTSEVIITPSGGNDLGSELKINGVIETYNTVVVNDTFTIELTPTITGSTSFTINILKNGISSTQVINLNSLVPTFTISVNPLETIIWNDEFANTQVAINTAYNHSIDYHYNIYQTQIPTQIFNGNPPGIQTLQIDPNEFNLDINNYINYQIEVVNEYGYSVISNNISLLIKDILPNINGLTINTNNPVSANHYDSVSDILYNIDYYNNIDIILDNLIVGKYNIDYYNLTIKWFEQGTNISPVTTRIKSVNNINYINNTIPQDFGSTRSNTSYNNYNMKTSSQGNPNVYYSWSTLYDELAAIQGKNLIRDLNNLITGQIEKPTISIDIVDVNGNTKTFNFVLDNGWGYYSY